MPTWLSGESVSAYTDRLTGADGGATPFDHKRFRQCSIGWHDECSDPDGDECECPCHQEAIDTLRERVDDTEDESR